MGFLAWIILGLIVGAIVKAVMPGRVGGGWVTSLVLGIIAVLLCLLPIINNLAFVLALVGLPFGIVAWRGAKKGQHRVNLTDAWASSPSSIWVPGSWRSWVACSLPASTAPSRDAARPRAHPDSRHVTYSYSKGPRRYIRGPCLLIAALNR